MRTSRSRRARRSRAFRRTDGQGREAVESRRGGGVLAFPLPSMTFFSASRGGWLLAPQPSGTLLFPAAGTSSRPRSSVRRCCRETPETACLCEPVSQTWHAPLEPGEHGRARLAMSLIASSRRESCSFSSPSLPPQRGDCRQYAVLASMRHNHACIPTYPCLEEQVNPPLHILEDMIPDFKDFK